MRRGTTYALFFDMRATIPTVLVLALTACASSERRFPLRDPMWRDTDLQSVYVRCRPDPTPKDPHHVSCAPEPYDATIYWDGADNMVFRPLSDSLGVVAGGEAVNVNSLDETPDSAWFTNRVPASEMTAETFRLGPCDPKKLLDADSAPDGSWLIDKGKGSGSTPGFRMTVPGKGKFLVKLEVLGLPERQVAASVIGETVFHAAGYNASCEQAIFVKPSVFKLAPGLRARHGNFGDEYDFDQKALQAMFDSAYKRDGKLRISASAWVSGLVIGQFRYEGTRDDDPNDVIPHENRRELRGLRLLAAWLDHFDMREGNSLDTWVPDDKKGPPDASPGHVVHYQIGSSAALGSVWDSDDISRRLGHSYVFDWGDLGLDLVTLGIPIRPWDTARKVPGFERFNYLDTAAFDPEKWKNEYPNAAFDRMTERDAAWIARILAGFSREKIDLLAEMGQFSSPADAKYLADALDIRLHKILERYLLKLSPISRLRVDGGHTLCAVDIAEQCGLRPASAFHYGAASVGGGALAVERKAGGQVCVALPTIARDERAADDAPERYVRIVLRDGVAGGALTAHLYDLGPKRGYRLVGLERKMPE